MIIPITDEIVSICRDIAHEEKELKDWAAIESGDMFQSNSFCGGFDSTEQEFTFSYYDRDNSEWWFQLSLENIENIASGALISITAREAE